MKQNLKEMHLALCEHTKDMLLKDGQVIQTHFLFGRESAIVHTPCQSREELNVTAVAIKKLVKEKKPAVYSMVTEATVWVSDPKACGIDKKNIHNINDEDIARIKETSRQLDALVVVTQSRGGECFMASYEVIRDVSGKVVDVMPTDHDFEAISGRYANMFE